jgi:hypothetical protein
LTRTPQLRTSEKPISSPKNRVTGSLRSANFATVPGMSSVMISTPSGMPGTWNRAPGSTRAGRLIMTALHTALEKQDVPWNTTRGTSASTATRCVNPRKKSETSTFGGDGRDATNSAKGSRRRAVARRNAGNMDGDGRAPVDSTPVGSGGYDGNGSSMRSTDAGRRLHAKVRLAGVMSRLTGRLLWCTERAVAKWSNGSVSPFAMNGKITTWSLPDSGLPLMVMMARPGQGVAVIGLCRVELYPASMQ